MVWLNRRFHLFKCSHMQINNNHKRIRWNWAKCLRVREAKSGKIKELQTNILLSRTLFKWWMGRKKGGSNIHQQYTIKINRFSSLRRLCGEKPLRCQFRGQHLFISKVVYLSLKNVAFSLNPSLKIFHNYITWTLNNPYTYSMNAY